MRHRVPCFTGEITKTGASQRVARDERNGTDGNERTMRDAEKTESGEGASTKKMRVVDQRRYDERARHDFD